MKIAVLGLGRMGQAIAYRLAEGGHDLTVWNRSPGKAGELVKAGATEAGSPEEAMAPAEVVLTSLSNDEAVRDIAVGPKGIRSGIGSRAYVDASTVSPALSAELSREFARFVAMPVLGAPQAVQSGQATYLAGGDQGSIDSIQPLLDSLGGQVKRYARAELASAGKLAVNLMLLTGVATLAEALAVGRAGGLSDDELADLIGHSPMLAPGLQNRFEGVLKGGGQTWWTTTLGAKDAGLAVATAESAGKKLRLGPTVRDIYLAAAEAGFDQDDLVAVARLYQ